MKKDSSMRRLVGLVMATGSALWFGALGPTMAQTPRPHASIAVFDEHYVFAGKPFDDLDALQDAVNDRLPWFVRLDSCSSAAARAQRAAAHRFRHLYLELRVLEPSAPSCQSAVVPRVVPIGQRAGQRPFGIYDEAVDRWWNNVMP
ncbi:MAG TPA: hypothetical protein VES91_00355 [Burkholderiaceae bacterium]|nr:hypothetical protein [Burkholderiaceae bacterium]